MSFYNLVKRILLYQILINFSLTKFGNNIIISQNDFFNKLYILLTDLGFSNISILNIPEDDDIIFRIILITILTISLLSILNFNLMQFMSGLICILIGFIYYNPFIKINELNTKIIIINLFNIDYFIPSLDLLIYICAGIAMIYESIKDIDIYYFIFCCYLFDVCENEGKRKNKRKCKFNLQIEFESNNYKKEITE